MINIGLIDLDTSHPAFFASLLRRTEDVRVTAVFDSGAVQTRDYVARFAAEHGIERICASLDELLSAVDGAMVLSQNWDAHLDRARPFLEAGKPVFIDKPIVGRLRDAEALLALAGRTGAPVMGGSTMRYVDEFAALREKAAGLGDMVSAFASGPGDVLNYGAHVVEMVTTFFGARVEAVTHIGGERSHLFLLEQRAGPPVVLQLSSGRVLASNGCVFALTTERSVEVVQPPNGWTMRDSTLRALTRFFREGVAPVPLEESLHVIRVCLAAAESRRAGRRVALADIPPGAGFDGAAYTRDFARLGAWQGDGLSARSLYDAGATPATTHTP